MEKVVLGTTAENLEFFRKNNKCGFKDKETGEVVIEAMYDFAWNFIEGLAKVKLNGKYGYIDATGKVVGEIKYDWVRDFIEGRSIVQMKDKCGIIDATGKVVVEIKYGEIIPSDDKTLVIFGKRVYFIDADENEVTGDLSEHFDFYEDEETTRSYNGQEINFDVDCEGNITCTCKCYRCGYEDFSMLSPFFYGKCDRCGNEFCGNCYSCASNGDLCFSCVDEIAAWEEYVYMNPAASGNIHGDALFQQIFWRMRHGKPSDPSDYAYDKSELYFESDERPATIGIYGGAPDSLTLTSSTSELSVNYIEEIYCVSCGIYSLKVSGASIINCSYNNISFFKVDGCKYLKTLNCRNNDMESNELNTLFESLHSSKTIEGKTITITGNPGASTCDRTIAEKKGWTVIV